VTEERLRMLAARVLEEVDHLLEAEPRSGTTAALRSALALPIGEARTALVSALGADRELRAWIGRQLSGERVVIRAIPMPTSARLGPLGVHVICPQQDYDRFLPSPEDDAGRCPNHGAPLISTPKDDL
jgi:hypothetical protein